MDEKIKDRDRDEATRKGVIDPQSLRKLVAQGGAMGEKKPIGKLAEEKHKLDIPPAVPPAEQLSPEQVKFWKSYVCENCKICAEYEKPKKSNSTLCASCSCELIHHLRPDDESASEDEDAQEWHDSSDEESEDGESEEEEDDDFDEDDDEDD
jgi:hypothetical protein